MFYFKGISSKVMNVVAEEEDFIGRAPLKYEEIQTDGANGSIFNTLGYDNISVSLKLYVIDDKKLDDILDWLTGEGDFEYMGRKTKAYFFDSIIPKRASNIHMIETTFIRSPFWYDALDTFEQIEGDYAFNFGNIYSQPIIKLNGKNGKSVDISIGDIRFSYVFDEMETVEIDCECKTEKANGICKSGQISIGFDYPILRPKQNRIIIHSGQAEIFMKRKDRWR